ncbi:MAG: MBL fold metallo-hydrolase [Deltaproteobacteria bacterium]|nr:MBL fold metallo-hydrolase [Deltaproteobacteria bacterium]
MTDDVWFPSHQGSEEWQSVAELTNISNPLFEKTLFLLGYDFSSNMYLLQGEHCSFIDTGNDYHAFVQLLEMGIKPTDIKKIALTHGHHDHVMGAIELYRGHRGYADQLDVEVFMHAAGPVEFKQIVKDLGYRITELKGGETINLSGFDFEVIYTPGHTIDGLSFYHAPTKTLFSGDTVMPLAIAEVDDKGAGGRLDHYLYALRSLLKLDIEHVLAGHGGVAPNIGRFVVEETYDGLIKKVVGVQTPLMEGAAELAQKGLLEEALFYVNKELKANAEDSKALEFKAFLLNDLGRNQEALEVFNAILAGDEEQPYILMGKGCALLGLGRYEESLPCFEDALKRNPQLKEVEVYKGMALYLSGRVDEAMDLEAFKTEFATKFKGEMEKLSKGKS